VIVVYWFFWCFVVIPFASIGWVIGNFVGAVATFVYGWVDISWPCAIFGGGLIGFLAHTGYTGLWNFVTGDDRT
jgi:hypothetical protein